MTDAAFKEGVITEDDFIGHLEEYRATHTSDELIEKLNFYKEKHRMHELSALADVWCVRRVTTPFLEKVLVDACTSQQYEDEKLAQLEQCIDGHGRSMWGTAQQAAKVRKYYKSMDLDSKRVAMAVLDLLETEEAPTDQTSPRARFCYRAGQEVRWQNFVAKFSGGNLRIKLKKKTAVNEGHGMCSACVIA